MTLPADWSEKILTFWYEELTPADWFEVRPQVDETIRQRFLALHEALARQVPAQAREEAGAALAAIIVLDQFPRNMFRGQPRAFATDAQALALSRNAVEKGFDRDFDKTQRQFLYMPFMHSEALEDQERCVTLFSTLGEDLVKFAIEHRDIVGRFGRFPHRNMILARESTDGERAFLSGHKGFGQ